MKLILKITVVLLLFVGGIQLMGSTVNAALRDEEAQDKLNKISEEEQTIVEKLFLLSSEIELLNTQLIKLGEEIQSTEKNIALKEYEISVIEETYENLKSNLAQVLKIQQRSGVASTVEIILNAKSLKDLVNRINLLRDLSKNVDQLMNQTLQMQSQLASEKEYLNSMLLEMEKRETILTQTALEKDAAKHELQQFLEGLASEKEYYQEYLDSISKLWESLKPLFSKTINSFTEIIDKGDLPEDTVEVNISLFNTRGIIKEDKFNMILAARNDLPKLIFDFKESGVKLSFPSYEVQLDGYFDLIDNQTIQYIVTGGQFYKLPMSESALEDLFSEGDLIFNLKSILGKNTIKKIENFEDRLELQISISLF